jgi:hypothetical protein
MRRLVVTMRAFAAEGISRQERPAFRCLELLVSFWAAWKGASRKQNTGDVPLFLLLALIRAQENTTAVSSFERTDCGTSGISEPISPLSSLRLFDL